MLDRTSRLVRGTSLLLVAFVVSVFVFKPVPAAADVSGGTPADFSVGDKDLHGATGWNCTGSMWWLTADDNTRTVNYKVHCETGSLMDGIDVAFSIDKGQCGGGELPMGDIDEAENRDKSGVILTCEPEDGAPTILELCVEHKKHVWLGEERWRSDGCVPLNLGFPPDAPDPANEPVSADCPRMQPLEPWVTAIHPVAVSGGWRWESEGVMRVTGMTSSSGSGTDFKIGGANVYLYGYVQVNGSGVSSTNPIVPTSPADIVETRSGSSTRSTMSVRLDYRAGTVGLQTPEYSWKVGGAVQTTAFGSGVPDFDYSYLGYYASWDPSARTISNSKSQSLSMTDAQYAASSSNGVNYSFNHDPARCYYNWGTQVGAARTGPINFRAATTPTPPPVVVVVPPPVVDIGDGCGPSTTHCVPLPPDVSDPVLPDPDGEDCQGFSISDPSTYGGQMVCAMVRLFSILYGLIETLIETVAAIFDLLTELLVPSDGLFGDIWASFETAWDDSELGEWSDALAGMTPDDPGGTSCEGPGFGPVQIIEGAEVPEMRPFDACGPREAPAGMVRGVLVVAATFAGAWRMWDMVVGSVGGYRGGGRHMSDSEVL